MSTSTGTVKWFNETKGFGFIAADEGKDIFAHFTDIQTQGFKVLLEGQRVEFTVVQGKKGPQASNIVILQNS
ncbi:MULTISPECIES: cold-shock protein [Acinetobacter]|jgi:CspA family cold shock protein|uniref:Cold shock protein CspV n=2 Tax=Acinetobacter pittii TaxID=48296 RepID=A0A0Q1YKU6_ACIPI|nr:MULTISPECIES: cold-shock protein [Acinetobacter]YP_004994763.1 cold-shock protein [Acinetobacter pittii PHEA-2]MDB0117257.1 cold-shock protein [Acinetobacter baumannii]MDR0069692.1 cold-shock protein [Acinetobacter sp. 11520]MDU6314229.1 cold-shock protein [Enterococcus faecalis]OBA10989.1 cold-shock protein [Acinetobacter calcoaceticus]ADY81081.1 probable cold-shock protein [Acinetobacter pittii PHEA-2]